MLVREDRDRESELVRVRQGMRDRESKRVVREGQREREGGRVPIQIIIMI